MRRWPESFICTVNLQPNQNMRMKASEELQALIALLMDPSVRRREMCARASKICKIYGLPATGVHSELAEFEYRVSGICQRCQDFYLGS